MQQILRNECSLAKIDVDTAVNGPHFGKFDKHFGQGEREREFEKRREKKRVREKIFGKHLANIVSIGQVPVGCGDQDLPTDARNASGHLTSPPTGTVRAMNDFSTTNCTAYLMCGLEHRVTVKAQVWSNSELGRILS